MSGYGVRFLDIPLEVRQEIYFYALLYPYRTGDPIMEGYSNVFPHDSIQIWSKEIRFAGRHWGTEKMTRLLRVCKQIHYEALPILYSRFTFQWHDIPVSQVSEVVNPLSLLARSSIRSVSFGLLLDTKYRIDSKCKYDRQKGVFECLAKSLPGLRMAELRILCSGNDVEMWEQDEVVEAAVSMLSPLKEVENLIFVNETGGYIKQWNEMFWRIERRLKSGE